MRHYGDLFQPWGEHEDDQILTVATAMRDAPQIQIARAAAPLLTGRTVGSIRYRLKSHLQKQICEIWGAVAAKEADAAPKAQTARPPTMRVIVPVPCSTSISAVDAEISLPQLPWMPALTRASARPETTPDPRHSLVRRSPRPQHPTAALIAEMLRELQKADQ